ncbi:hypothetical protein C8R46DRAFT_1072174, partial [Mycena filopes]
IPTTGHFFFGPPRSAYIQKRNQSRLHAHFFPPPPSMPPSNTSPRRRTLCTEDGRDVVPPQLPFFPPEMRSKSVRVARGAASTNRTMTINVQLADAGHKIRPLPRIPPTPNSAPPLVPHLSRSPSMRPLPTLPEAGSALAISVTPATPLPPPTPIVESHAHLAPPCIRRGPPRFASLSLQTSPDALNPNAFGPHRPASPTLPEPPSPRTARRKRISKLRRHLGESVQIILEQPDDKADVLAGLRRAVKADGVLDLDGDDSDASSEASSDGYDYAWQMTRERVLSNRSSQKWIRERGKDRWTEQNFAKILQDLRAL